MGVSQAVKVCLTIAVGYLSVGLAQFLLPCLPATASDIDAGLVDALERKLFMQTFTNQKMTDRLGTLEQRVFGTKMQGTLEERLARLQAAAGPASDAAFLVKPKNQASQNDLPAGGSPAGAREVEVPANAGNTMDREAAKEKERRAVQAAEEEEINLLMSQGVTAWREHDAQMAIERFQQVVRLDPHNAQAHFSLGIIYETNGDFQSAVDHYKLASSERPDDKDYLNAVAQAQKKLAGKQQVDDKQKDLRQLSQLALADYNRGEYLSALDLYKQLDQKYPEQAINKYNIGSVYLCLHQPERALEYYQSAHHLSPDDQKISDATDKLKVALEQNKVRTKTYPSRADVSAQSGFAEHGDKHHFSTHKSNMPTSMISNYGCEIKSSSHEVRVTSVFPASRAVHVGIEPGDIIKAVNGNVVESVEDVNRILAGCNPIRQLQLTVQRGKHLNQLLI